MQETLCFSIQSLSPNLDDLPLRCDGCETVSCVVGSSSDHPRIGLGSVSDRFRIVNGVSTVFRACVVDRIPLWFATVGSFPHCKWGCKWCWWMSCRWSFEEVSHEMRFWEIADARNPMFFHTKSVPEPRWSTSAVRRVRDGLVCGRIILGSDRSRIGSAL